MAPKKLLFAPKFMNDMADVKTLPSSLCFLEAFAARHYQRISQNEYYHHVFAHLTGVTHERDEADEGIRLLKESSLFDYAVLDSATKMGTLQDAQSFEQVFQAYSADDLEGVKSKVGSMKEEQIPYLMRMLAMQALLDRRPEILSRARRL